MSVEALAVVLHHSRATGTDKLVMVGIANHAGDGGAWPAVETLARYAGVTERTVQRSLRRLVELGELVVHKQQGGTAATPDWQRPNRYDVTVACPATCDRTTAHRPVNLPTGDLWKTGVTWASPGDVGVTPPGDVGVTRTIPTNPPLAPGSSQPHSSSASAGLCTTCGQAEAPCQSRQQSWPADDRHPFTPKATDL